MAGSVQFARCHCQACPPEEKSPTPNFRVTWQGAWGLHRAAAWLHVCTFALARRRRWWPLRREAGDRRVASSPSEARGLSSTVTGGDRGQPWAAGSVLTPWQEGVVPQPPRKRFGALGTKYAPGPLRPTSLHKFINETMRERDGNVAVVAVHMFEKFRRIIPAAFLCSRSFAVQYRGLKHCTGRRN